MSKIKSDDREEWRKLITNMMNEDPEVRCRSYKCLKIGIERGLRIKEPFSTILADCLSHESYGHLQSLLQLVETYVECHQETLYEDYRGYPIFKAFLFKYHEHVGACLNIMFLNHALVHMLETFPRKYLLILTIKLFGESPLPINVTQKGLYVAQSATEVTGEEISLITSLTPFEVLRTACITLMDLINTYRSYPELDIYQWSEDMIVGLWFTNRSQMMEVFKSLPGDVQKEVISMIQNYGSTKYGVLESKLPLEMEKMVQQVEVKCDRGQMVQSKCDKCDLSTKTVSVQERTRDSIQEISSKDSLPTEEIYDQPIYVRTVVYQDVPDVYVAKKEKDSSVKEEPHVDATKSETSVFSGNKVAARKSILNLLKHPNVLPASNDALSQLALDVKKGENEHELLCENQQNQKGTQNNDVNTEERRQEELNDLERTSDMSWESFEEVEVSSQNQEEIVEDVKRDKDFENEPEEVKYDTDDSQIDEDLIEGITEGNHNPEEETYYEEYGMENKDSFLADFSSQWETTEWDESSAPVATASGSASVSRIKSLMSIPSKITSLFRGKGFKSQTTISDQRVEGPESVNSSAKMYSEARKLLKVKIESVDNEIYNCRIEINSTELEIEELQKKIWNNNMLIQKRQKKMRERFSVVNF